MNERVRLFRLFTQDNPAYTEDLWAIPTGRWVFSVARDVARGEAWQRCVRSGLSAGIPQHAWRKRHSGERWTWFTADHEAIDFQSALVARRREEKGAAAAGQEGGLKCVRARTS